MKRLKTEVPERHYGGMYSSQGGDVIAIRKGLISAEHRIANLRKVVQ